MHGRAGCLAVFGESSDGGISIRSRELTNARELGGFLIILSVLIAGVVFCEDTWKRVCCGIAVLVVGALGVYEYWEMGWVAWAAPIGAVGLGFMMHSIKEYTP